MSEMNIESATQGEVTILRTQGYLDDVNGKQLKAICEKLIESGRNRFVFNLAGTPAINSTGLSMVLDVAVKVIDYNDGKIAITGLTKLTRTALQMTGILTLCDAFETEQEAVAEISK